MQSAEFIRIYPNEHNRDSFRKFSGAFLIPYCQRVNSEFLASELAAVGVRLYMKPAVVLKQLSVLSVIAAAVPALNVGAHSHQRLAEIVRLVAKQPAANRHERSLWSKNDCFESVAECSILQSRDSKGAEPISGA